MSQTRKYLSRYHLFPRRSLPGLLLCTAVLSTQLPSDLSAQLPTSGLVQRLRADSGVVTSGSFVTNWNDVSGAGHSVAQAGSGLQPTLVSNSMNGKPAIHFDASNDYLQGGAALDLRNSAYSIFVVGKRTAGDGNYLTMLSSECYRFQSNNTKYKNGGTLSYSGATVPSLYAVTRSSAGTVAVYRNGVQLASGSMITGSTTCSNFRIGGDGLSGIGGFDGFNGDIAEVLVYNSELSTTNRQAVESYLMSQYGLELPASGLVLRLQADSGVVTSGAAVTAWNDTSGAGNSVSQGTAGNQPTLVASSGINGKPAVRFDGSSDHLQGPAALDLRSSPYSIFLVAKPVAGDGNYFTMLSSQCFRFANNNLKYKNGGTLSYGGTLAATLQVVTRNSAGTVTVTRNGVQLASGTMTTGSTICSNFRIGGDGLSLIGGFDGYNGDIAEVLVYNQELPAGDRQTVENYLNSKYALTSNSAPAININSPTPATTYTAPASITINATATDTDGTISKVDFYYNGSNLIGTDSAYPYSVTWSNVAAGTYTLTAKATDNSGGVTTSAGVSITVNGATSTPFLTSFTPANPRAGHQGFIGMRITVGGSNITVTDLGRIFLNGNTGTHTVKIVREADGANVGSPVSISMPGGTHNQFKYVPLPSPVTLTAGQVYYIVSDEVSTGDQFYDSMSFNNAPVATCSTGVYWDGNPGWFVTGYPYCVASFKYQGGGTGNNPPSVNITSPTPGTNYAPPANITITANASDPDAGGSVTKVDFYYNGTNLIGSDPVSPYSITWSNVSAGSYSLTAKATDNLGAVTTSSAVSISAGSGTILPGGSYTGPVYIQPVAPRNASLHVERAGSQSSALDIYGSATSDAIRFWSSGSSTAMRGRFKSSGEYLTNGWFVVSGSYSGNLTNPGILVPSPDAAMIEIWSNIAGAAVAIRPHSSGTNAAVSTMDQAGKYRFSISPGGTLNFAGASSNTFTSAGFDTSLYRTGPGAISTSGSFSAASIQDTVVAVTLLNNSNRPVHAGDVLVFDPDRDGAFLPASPHSDNDVAGVARETIPAGASGSVVTLGLQEVSVKGAVNRGDRVVKGSENGVGRRANAGEKVPPGAVIGKALTGTAGGGRINVLVTAGN